MWIKIHNYLGNSRTALHAKTEYPAAPFPLTNKEKYTKKQKQKLKSRPFHMLDVNTELMLISDRANRWAVVLTGPSVLEDGSDFVQGNSKAIQYEPGLCISGRSIGRKVSAAFKNHKMSLPASSSYYQERLPCTTTKNETNSTIKLHLSMSASKWKLRRKTQLSRFERLSNTRYFQAIVI